LILKLIQNNAEFFFLDEDKAILHGSRKDQSTEKSAEKQQSISV